MADFQLWLVHVLAQATPVAQFMRQEWVWPAAESVHFIGLSLLIGTVGIFDLRLLGVAPRIPLSALHRLIPWGLVGFALNVITGLLFLMTEPDQYILNPAFHLKLLFILLAGLNALTFYLTVGTRALAPVAGRVPRAAMIIGAVSLSLWIGVIIAGRLITFYRPFECDPGPLSLVLMCLPQ
jgi:hypothetical protein